MSATYTRLLQEHGGDVDAALKHLCRSYDYVCSKYSVGYARAGQRTDRAAKAYVEGIDVDHTSSPHG